jgi:hypothetical protein
MSKLKIEVVGEKAVEKELAKLDAEIRELGKPARAGAQLIARQAAGYGPNPSGDLSASYRALGTARSGRIVSRLPYSAVIEFGWSRRNIAEQLRVYRALEDQTPAVMALFEDYVRGRIRAAG